MVLNTGKIKIKYSIIRPMKDIHPFEPFVPANATKLIIGTIPPHRFCVPNKLLEKDIPFYYGSRDNYFWDLIAHIYQSNFSSTNAVEAMLKRTTFLKKHNFGITDIIKSCSRKNESSSDSDLMDIVYKDLSLLLMENKNIDTLIYTSDFVKKCINHIYKSYHEIDKNDRRKQFLTILGNKYNVWVLYSPSPQALRNMGKNGKDKRMQQYLKVFKEIK